MSRAISWWQMALLSSLFLSMRPTRKNCSALGTWALRKTGPGQNTNNAKQCWRNADWIQCGTKPRCVARNVTKGGAKSFSNLAYWNNNPWYKWTNCLFVMMAICFEPGAKMTKQRRKKTWQNNVVGSKKLQNDKHKVIQQPEHARTKWWHNRCESITPGWKSWLNHVSPLVRGSAQCSCPSWVSTRYHYN